FVQSLFADWMYFLFLGFLPLELLFVRDALHRGKGLRADLKKGFVKRYAGPFRSLPETDETVLRLKKKELLPSALGTDWSLEALPETGRIWKVNETFVSPWIQARWVELANAPAFATVAAEWLEPVQRVEDVTLLRGER